MYRRASAISLSSGTLIFNTDTLTLTGGGAGVTNVSGVLQAQGGGQPSIAVFTFSNVDLAAGTTIQIVGWSTGWLSAVLLGALGADRATITEDYLLTNEVTGAETEKLLGVLDQRKGVPPGVLRPVLDAAPEYLDAAFERVEAQFGTLDRYLRAGLGLDDADLAALHDRLVG